MKVIGSGSIVFVSYLTAIGDERFYANQLMPLLQRTVGVDAAHLLMVRLIGLGLVPGIRYQDPVSLVSLSSLLTMVFFLLPFPSVNFAGDF